MIWKQFYDGYLCWSDSTVSSRLSQISDLQNADSTEIVDCCQCIDEALARRVIGRNSMWTSSHKRAEMCTESRHSGACLMPK